MSWEDPMDEGIARRPLHMFFLLDCSGSMAVNGKIQALNNAMVEVLPEIKTTALSNPGVQVLVRCMAFSDSAQWLTSDPVPVESFRWEDVLAGGLTATGQALELLAEALKSPPMPARACPPVIILISDGEATDDFQKGLDVMQAQGWARKAIRVSIGIGDDSRDSELAKFVRPSEIGVLKAHNNAALVRHIKWASTVPVKSASMPSPGKGEGDAIAVPAPPPLPPDTPDDADWVDFDA